MADYRRYLRGNSRRVDGVAIFEIGGLGGGRGDPIIDSLPQRKAERVVYRGIVRPHYKHPWDRGMSPEEWQRKHSKELLQKHVVRGEGIDTLVIPWDGKDVPYPFPDNSFDEFHCHMITDRIVAPKRDEYCPSPEDFADEVNRLLKNRGRIYLTTQMCYFFQGHHASLAYSDCVDLADRMIQRLRTREFVIDVLDCDPDMEGLHDKNPDVPVGNIDYGSLRHFTREGAYTAMVLIATKLPRRRKSAHK